MTTTATRGVYTDGHCKVISISLFFDCHLYNVGLSEAWNSFLPEFFRTFQREPLRALKNKTP